MPARKRHLLILGGTTEAAALAKAAGCRFDGRLLVTTSLAGRTATPRTGPGALRVGGFGGVQGLADCLRSEEVDLVIDATHPFADRISANARQACAATNTPRMMFVRAPWNPLEGDFWKVVPDISSAAASLPGFGSRAFLSLGSQKLEAFSQLQGIHLIVRMIDPPKKALPLANYAVILGRGPFTEESETDLLRCENIDVIVSRNSGGDSTYAKIAAARNLGLPVIMIAPPRREAGRCTDNVEGALQWIAEELTRVAS